MSTLYQHNFADFDIAEGDVIDGAFITDGKKPQLRMMLFNFTFQITNVDSASAVALQGEGPGYQWTDIATSLGAGDVVHVTNPYRRYRIVWTGSAGGAGTARAWAMRKYDGVR